MNIARLSLAVALTAIVAGCSFFGPPSIPDELANAGNQQDAIAAVTAWTSEVSERNAVNWPKGYAIACAADPAFPQYDLVCPMPGSDKDTATGWITGSKGASGYSYGFYLKASQTLLDQAYNPFTFLSQYADNTVPGFGGANGDALPFVYEYVKVLGPEPDGPVLTHCIQTGASASTFGKLALSCELKHDVELTITVAKK